MNADSASPLPSRRSSPPYQSWIDWFKVLGMAVILFGHTGGASLIPPWFNPINAKQLGVAMFVFVTAFTLAWETRHPVRVIYRRYFEVAVLGLLFAIFLSVVQWFRIGDINESNYLPFVFGLNVVWENAFPANPTTWYIGTYFHLLVAWAVALRFFPSRWPVLLAILVVELGVRAAWMAFERDFNAYMFVTSWLSVFFLGQWFGRSFRDSAVSTGTLGPGSGADAADRLPVRLTSCTGWIRRTLAILAIAVLMGAWLAVVRELEISKSNPFGRIPVGSDVTNAVVTSLAVTAEYTVFTLLLFAIVYGMPAGRFVRFLSRNTLFVFIAHMPVRDWVTPLYYPFTIDLPWGAGGWFRQGANFVVLFVGLALVSEALRYFLGLKKRGAGTGRELAVGS